MQSGLDEKSQDPKIRIILGCPSGQSHHLAQCFRMTPERWRSFGLISCRRDARRPRRQRRKTAPRLPGWVAVRADHYLALAVAARQSDCDVADGKAEISTSGSARRALPPHQRSYLTDTEAIPVALRPIGLDRVEQLAPHPAREEFAAELSSKHRRDVVGGRDNPSSGAVERHVDLGYVHRTGSGQDPIVSSEIAMGARAAQRSSTRSVPFRASGTKRRSRSASRRPTPVASSITSLSTT